MKKSLIFSILVSSIIFISPAYSQSSLCDTVKLRAAAYFNQQYKGEDHIYTPNDINERFEIVDILTRQRVHNKVRNGRIYRCVVLGDDIYGVFLMLENNKCTLLEIRNVLQAERARLFMQRHNYTLEQMNRCFDYLTLIYTNEHYFDDFNELKESTDYIEYRKEANVK